METKVAVCLPLTLTFWIGRYWSLPVEDPTGLVMLTGVLLGLLPVLLYLTLLRRRNR